MLPTPIVQLPPPYQTATANAPGAAPHWPPTLADVGVDSLRAGTVPAFVANAASIAPGTDKGASYTIEVTRALAAASALTVATTSMPARGCDVFIICKSLALGYILSVVNGGPAAGTMGTFAASLTTPEFMRLWWDGTNFIFNGQDWINP
jgi:hypothetical protein